MTVDSSDSRRERDPIDLLAESFLARYRKGERPSIDEYVARFPHLAEEVREILPALVVLDRDMSIGGTDLTGDFDGGTLFNASKDADGLRVLGDYRILRELGRGGMGVVYEAVQQSLGRSVALKILPWNEVRDQARLERFQLEARAAARMHHTNIVPVFGVGEHCGIHYYAMQYIRGQGLDQVIAALDLLKKQERIAPAKERSSRGKVESDVSDSMASTPGRSAAETLRMAATVSMGLMTGHFRAPSNGGPEFFEDTASGRPPEIPRPMPEPTDTAPADNPQPRSDLLTHSEDSSKAGRFYREVARVGLQAADALAYAHGQGILHRDIKPSNLLLDVNGQLWITDFGLAKAEGSEGPTQTGDIIGTLRYMAPERFEGAGDCRMDVYGLGATLYELATLRPLFEGPTRARLIEKVLHGQPVSPRRIDPRIPRDLETIILKSVDKDPNRRYPHARSMAEDLRLFFEDKPILARRIGRPEQLARWCRRNPLLAATAASLIVVLLAVSVGSTILARRFRLDAESSRESLVRLNVAAGVERMDRGDVLGALPYLAGALEMDREVEAHRLRLGATFRRAPRLVELWAHPSIVRGAQFSPDGKRVVSACFDGHARIFAVGTEAPVAQDLLHEDAIEMAAFNHDGRRVVTASRDGTARVWDATSGQPLTPPLKHGKPVQFAEFSPSGDRVVTASINGEARVWDASTGAPLTPVLMHPLNVAHAKFSPDGSLVATACDDGLARIWDAATGTQVGKPRAHRKLSRVAFRPDGKRLATAGWDGMARVWDVAGEGKEICSVAHSNVVSDLSFSPDGSRLATASWDGTARVWDPGTGKAVSPPIAQGGAVQSVCFSADGRRVLCAGADGIATIADAVTGRLASVPLTHNGSVFSAVFSPDGRSVVTASADRFVRVWDDLGGASEDAILAHPERVGFVAFSPDGTRVVTGGTDGQARVWGAATGEQTCPPMRHAKSIEVAEFSPDGRRIVTASWDGTARVWDALTGAALTPPMDHGGTPIHDAAFSPDGRLVVTSCEDGGARIWRSDNGQPIAPYPRHASNVRHACFSPDSRYVLTASNDYTARVWDVAEGRWAGPPLRHGGIVYDASFSPDGRHVVTGSEDGTARVWDAFSGVPVGPPIVHRAWVLRVCFAPDGRTALAAGTDGTVLLWDVANGQLVCPPLTHHGSVFSATFSSDSRWVATASFDGTARVWDAANGEPVTMPLSHPAAVWCIAFSPDGRRIATAGYDGTARLWSLRSTGMSVSTIVRSAEILSGRAFDPAGRPVPLATESLLERWKPVRSGSIESVQPRR